MINRELVLKKAVKIEDRLFLSKMVDRAQKAVNSDTVMFSDFIDPYQKSIFEKAFSDEDSFIYSFDGGYEGAEREVVVFCPSYMSTGEREDSRAPLKALKISLKGRENLTHRDCLGAVTALGIKREKIGDIIVREESCNIIVLNEVAEFIRANLEKVGSANVTAEIAEISDIGAPLPRTREINATVASLRLDSISSAGFGISRSRISDFIKAEKVSLNWQATDSPSKQIKEGDTISIKGKGRVVIERVGGTTKKGRISVVLKKYV